jgi:KUP system potassium uptake protein
MQNLKHNHVLHRINIFLAGTTDNVPRVPDDERSVVEDIGHGCYSVTVRHGFMELPNVPAVLLVEKHIPDWRYDPAATSFFLTRDTVLATGESRSMAVWREKLFALLGRNAARASEYYSLPADRVVELGEQISL